MTACGQVGRGPEKMGKVEPRTQLYLYVFGVLLSTRSSLFTTSRAGRPRRDWLVSWFPVTVVYLAPVVNQVECVRRPRWPLQNSALYY